MIKYYENKMNDSHRQWEEALSTDKPIAAEKHMKDYLNYKALYDARLAATGGESDV